MRVIIKWTVSIHYLESNQKVRFSNPISEFNYGVLLSFVKNNKADGLLGERVMDVINKKIYIPLIKMS